MAGQDTHTIEAVPIIDDLLGNRAGSTARIFVEQLAAQIMAQIGPQVGTLSALQADLNWPPGTFALVMADTDARNGRYRKSGSYGSGNWARTGDIPAQIVRDRALHIGSQPMTTVQGLDEALDGKQPAGDYALAAEVRRMSSVELDMLGLLIGAVDANRLRLWLEVSRETGGPSDHAARMIWDALDRMGAVFPRRASIPGVLTAGADATGLRSYLEARLLDGAPTDWASQLIDKVALERGSAMTDMAWIAGWGSSTLEYLAPELRQMALSLGASYHDGGDAGAWSPTILGQMGVVPARITFPGGTLPGSGAVGVSVAGIGPHSSIRPWRGVVRGSGVEGTLIASDTAWSFQRHGEGPAVSVAPNTPFLPIDGHRFADVLPILNLGKNDLIGGRPASVAIEATHAAFRWLPTSNKRALLLGHFSSGNANADLIARVNQTNEALAAAYGGLFIDLNGYLLGTQIWADTGITPTADDSRAQGAGQLAPSLRLDNLHINAAANRAVVTHLIRPRLIALGYYNGDA